MLQSHALHFFHLCSPTCSSVSIPTSPRNIVRRRRPPGNRQTWRAVQEVRPEVIRHTAGKVVHGTGLVPGGVTKALTVAERDELLKDIYPIIAWSLGTPYTIQKVHIQDPGLYNSFGIFRSNFMSIKVGHNGESGFSTTAARCARDDKRLYSTASTTRTTTATSKEEVKPWSYMKFPSRVDRRRKRLVQGGAVCPGAELRPDSPLRRTTKERNSSTTPAALHARPLAYH